MKQRFSTERKGRQEFHPVQRIANTGFRRLRNAFLLAVTVAVSAANAQPTFTKVFSPSTIGPGSVSTLTFTITNGTGAPVTDLAFTDILPISPGDVDIATPPNASTTCDDGVVTAPAGGGTISLSDGELGDGEACTVTVDLTASTPGAHTNPAITLSSSAGSSMSTAVDLTVATTLPGFSKSFGPSSVPLGGRSTLTFTIDNSLNSGFAFSLAFTDNLPVGMEIASPADASTTCTFFATPVLTAVPGTSVVSLSGGGVAAESTCTVSVDVVATGGGMLDNISGELTSGPDSPGVSSGTASATLDVTVDTLHLTKSFTDDPVPPGGTATLQFTIDNFDRIDSATGIEFTDDLALILPGTPDITALGLPLTGLCPAGNGTLTGSAGDTFLTFSGPPLPPGATLAPEDSCTFTVDLAVPAGAPVGIHTNTTSTITGTIFGSPVTGSAASDDLFVQPAPMLTKVFTDAPVGGGDTVTLEFTITNTSPTSTATDIAFVDEFDSVLPTASSIGAIPAPGTFCGGATATFTPLDNPDPPSSVIPATLVVTGGSLTAADPTCTFSIILDVLVGAAGGTYPNTTSEITATVDAMTVTGNPATDDLVVVAGPRLTKEFTDDPAQPDGTVTLEFTLAHDPNAPGDATGITFTDDLAAILPGTPEITASGLPLDDLCGPGNGSLAGTAMDTLLTFSGRDPDAGRNMHLQRHPRRARRCSWRNPCQYDQ